MSAPEILYRVEWHWPGLADRVRYAYATRGAADELVAGLREVGWVVGSPRPAEASTRPPAASRSCTCPARFAGYGDSPDLHTVSCEKTGEPRRSHASLAADSD